MPTIINSQRYFKENGSVLDSKKFYHQVSDTAVKRKMIDNGWRSEKADIKIKKFIINGLIGTMEKKH